METHNCIICGFEIKNLFNFPDTKNGCWDGGIISEIEAGYGSTLDGDKYVIAICDFCIIKNKLPKISK